MNGPLRLTPAQFSTLEAQRICLIKPSALGDVVQTLPVLSALRARFPSAHIAWVLNRAYASLLRPVAQLDEIIEFDRDRYRRHTIAGMRAYIEFLKTLREKRFDLTIDLQGLLRSGSMALATLAPHRFGLATAREGSRWFYTNVVDDRPKHQRAVDRYWKVAEILGVGHLEKDCSLDISFEERRWAKEVLAGLPHPVLGINAGARWMTKRWPADRFAQAAGRALATTGGSVVLLGGPGDERIAEEVASHLAVPFRNLCGRTTLRRLASVLESCDLVLTNDSGPMHLASAVRTPTVSIFTCTDPERAAPNGKNHRFVQTSVRCKASYLKCCDRMICMDELTTEKVLPILSQSLNEVLSDFHPARASFPDSHNAA